MSRGAIRYHGSIALNGTVSEIDSLYITWCCISTWFTFIALELLSHMGHFRNLFLFPCMLQSIRVELFPILFRTTPIVAIAWNDSVENLETIDHFDSIRELWSITSYGSLAQCGAIVSYGSIRIFVTIWFIGSFLTDGAITLAWFTQ